MKFMQTIMSCRKEIISDEFENSKTMTAQNLSENLCRKIFIFLMYLSAIIFSFIWFSVLFRISFVMIWIHNNLKKKTEEIYYYQLQIVYILKMNSWWDRQLFLLNNECIWHIYCFWHTELMHQIWESLNIRNTLMCQQEEKSEKQTLINWLWIENQKAEFSKKQKFVSLK